MRTRDLTDSWIAPGATREWFRSFAAGVAALLLVGAGASAIAQTETASQTAKPRELWLESKLVGSPEPPSPYVVEKTFTNLVVKSPLYIAPEPATDNLMLLDRQPAEPQPWQIRRIRNDLATASSETLLSFTNRQVYGLTFHPRYAQNGFVYVFHNGPTDQPERTNRISRFTVSRAAPWAIVPASESVVIEWRSAGHDGGDLAFGSDGMLYITSGDGTSDSDGWDSGQDMSRLLAKLLRIDVDKAPPGKTYDVPADNPFVALAGARPETWAYGFRNPWRLGIDERTGDIWVGQNGQDLWESAHLVRKGDNIGWSVYEGGHPFHPHRRRGPTPIVPPTIEHSHALFRSLTGGVVYYGEELPELNGAYVYGDFSTGKIWGARNRDGRLEWHRELLDTTLQIVAFRVVPNGRLLVVDHAGGLYRVLPRPAEKPAPPFPKLLSQTGLFASTKEHRPAPGLIPYEVNAPGWADGAKAQRFIALPGAAKIQYTQSRGWNFTNGSAIVQTLWLGMGDNASEARQRVETRVLLRQDGEWSGYSYRWNQEQTDALLVGSEGEDISVRVQESGQTGRAQAWRIPSRAECMTCHSRAVNFVLGLTQAQMNRLSDQSSGTKENQISLLKRLDVLTEAPQVLDESSSRLVDPRDASAPIDLRARSYLHANCSNCHVEAGGGNARLGLEITRPVDQMNLIASRPQHDTFGIVNAMLVAPGDPARSVLLHRVNRRGRGQMPPLVSSLVDETAVEVLRQWVAGLKSESAVVREWTMADLEPLLPGSTAERSLVEGKSAFEKTGCAQCHRLGDVGGAMGPDLTSVGKRLDRRALLESILEPSKAIAEEYAAYDIETSDGELLTGRIEREDSDALILRTNSAVDDLRRVKKSAIVKRTKSGLSNMPSGMLNALSENQILDLLAYLLADGATGTAKSPIP